MGLGVWVTPQIAATATGRPAWHGPTDLTRHDPLEGCIKTAALPPSWKPTYADVWLAAAVAEKLATAQYVLVAGSNA
jgi:hypothetical protein